MTYGDFKDILRRLASDKYYVIKHFNKNLKYNGYQHGLALFVCTFFDKKSSGANTSVGAMTSEIIPNQLPWDLAYVANVSDLE